MRVVHRDLKSFGCDHDDCIKVVLVRELDAAATDETRRLYSFAQRQIDPRNPAEPVIAFTLQFNSSGLIMVTNFKRNKDAANLILDAIGVNAPNTRKVSVLCPDDIDPDALAGCLIREFYLFQPYHTKKEATIDELYIHSGNGDRSGAVHEVTAGFVNFARDLVMMPANKLGPHEFGERVVARARGLSHVKVSVLSQAQLEALGMGAMLSVATGSTRPPCLVVVDYSPPTGGRPVVLCGKGVTFDTGGISLKPPRRMHEMKGDMGGAAAAVAAVMAAATVGLKHRVVALAGMIENFPGRGAVIPGDVVTSMSGKTIEVLDTDAEGRMVLADLLHYAHTHYPTARCIVDLATLTGAIVAGLGHHYAGLYTRDDAMAARLLAASEASGDALWRMPMENNIKTRSTVADLKNINDRETSGCNYAAVFLEEFTSKEIAWCHVDMAGVNFLKHSENLVASGYGVSLMMSFLIGLD